MQVLRHIESRFHVNVLYCNYQVSESEHCFDTSFIYNFIQNSLPKFIIKQRLTWQALATLCNSGIWFT